MTISMNTSSFKAFTHSATLSFGSNKQEPERRKGIIAPLVSGTMLALNMGCQQGNNNIDLSNECFLGIVAEDPNALGNPKKIFSQEEISNLKTDPSSLKKLQESGKVKKSVEMYDITKDGAPDAIYEDSSSIDGRKNKFVHDLKNGAHFALIDGALYKYYKSTLWGND